ncbi:MAG TPA: DUF423 domain-containing protein [Bauldia sp.]|nr:DUF423 domain-containing protein [Bauldia sp.]
MAATQAFHRILLFLAGLLGAGGVAAAAASTHGGDPALLGPLSLIALTQAPALAALALHPGASRLVSLAALVIALGAIAFCGDLAVRHFTGHALVPMLAPAGGAVMIAGWLLLALAGLLGFRRG